jgi:hypothetical protein
MEKGGRDRHEYDDRILLRQRMTPVVRRARVPLNREIRYSGPGALSPRSWARGMSAGVLPTTNTRPCLFGSACGRMFIDFVHQSDKEITDVFMKPSRLSLSLDSERISGIPC